MIEERLQDLSVVYYLKNNLDSTVEVVDGFPTTDINSDELPVVAVENSRATFNLLELGTLDAIAEREWIIYIYAKNKSQRDNLAYTISTLLRQKIPVYDYNNGFPPDVSPPQVGTLQPERVSVVIAQIDPTLVSTLYYRAEVHYMAQYLSTIGG